MSLVGLTIALVMSVSSESPPWEVGSSSEGVTVYKRDRPGSKFQEFKTMGVIAAPIDLVWARITDFKHLKETTPSAQKADVVAVTDEGRSTHIYFYTTPPLITPRDYCLK